MTSDRSAALPAKSSTASTDNAWTRFWFAAVTPMPLRVLRVLSGLLFIAWLASFLGHQAEFFSLNGWVDLRTLQEVRAQDQQSSPVDWSILYWAGESAPLFQAIYFGSLIVLVLFTLGFATRVTGVLTWVVVVSFVANPATLYDGDDLLAILAFYLMIGHLFVGQWNGNLSIAERILGARADFVLAGWLFPQDEQPASVAVNWTMRLLQLHVAIIIVISALHKLQGPDWWGGVALWYPLHPTFKMTPEGLQREAPNVLFTLSYLSLAAYIVLGWQLAFPVFAWRGGWWRGLLLGGAVIGWLGAYFLFGLPSFGPFVMIGCLSFLHAEEWAWAFERIRSVKVTAAAESKKVAVAAGKDSIKK